MIADSGFLLGCFPPAVRWWQDQEEKYKAIPPARRAIPKLACAIMKDQRKRTQRHRQLPHYIDRR